MSRRILHLRLAESDPALLRRTLELLQEITPYVQALPPDTADLDITGATGYFQCSALELGHLVRLRLAAHLDAAAGIGIAGNRMLAAMTAAAHPGRTGYLDDDPAAVASFLRPRPVRALPGIGAASAVLLARHGLRTVGALADTPLPTLQRLLGGAVGRAVHQHAHGIDPRPVTLAAPALQLVARHRFDRDELDPRAHHRAILALTEQVGLQLRSSRRRTRRITLTVRYADQSVTARSRVLREPADRSTELARAAALIYRGLGLQRARVRGIELRADELLESSHDPRQLSLDPREQRRDALEAAADRARARFGPDAVRPAELAGGGAPRAAIVADRGALRAALSPRAG